MEEWKEYRLGDLFERVTRKNTNLESKNVLTISAQHGLINQEEFFNKSVAGKNLTNYYVLKKGEFAYNKSYSAGYPMGATKMLEKYDDGIVSTLYICFRSKTELVYNEYFKYFFESKKYYEELAKIAQEGSRNHGLLNVSVKDFFNIKVMIPTLEEQKKIVEILRKVDLIIEKYERLLEEKNQFIKSQFIEIFGNVITNDKKWNLMKWKQVLTIKNGKKQKDVEDNNGRYPIYGSGGIIGYGNDYICNENTIVIGRKGNINKPFVVRKKFWNVDTAFGIEPIFNKISLSYLYMFCLIYNFNKLDQASAIPSLTKNDLLNIKIPVPPIIIQNQFEQIVKLVDKQKLELEKIIENYKKIKKGLMQQLLTEKIKVKI